MNISEYTNKITPDLFRLIGKRIYYESYNPFDGGVTSYGEGVVHNVIEHSVGIGLEITESFTSKKHYLLIGNPSFDNDTVIEL